MRRGVEYLLRTQNPDGSWGSKRDALLYQGLDEVFLNPETQRGWTVATTGLVCNALQKIDGDDAMRAAYDRGIDYVVQNAVLKRPSDWDIDVTWGFVYGLQGLAAAYTNPRYAGSARRVAIGDVTPRVIARLAQYQTPMGGWGYYEGDAGVTNPPNWQTSFMTASAVLALLDARDAGFAVDEGMLSRAVRAVARCRLPNGAYSYNIDPFNAPSAGEGINNIKGSLGRTQVCNLALLRSGYALRPEQAERGVRDFFEHHRFLDIARGRPIPHEAYYANAAYFYHFAHYYGARMIAELPAERRAECWPKLREGVTRTQQADGSMLDYYMNSYGKPYGTAFGVLALHESLRDEPASERGGSP